MTTRKTRALAHALSHVDPMSRSGGTFLGNFGDYYVYLDDGRFMRYLPNKQVEDGYIYLNRRAGVDYRSLGKDLGDVYRQALEAAYALEVLHEDINES